MTGTWSYLLVFLGGGVGAALRHGVNRAALAALGPSLPFGTLIVNIGGSLLIGNGRGHVSTRRRAARNVLYSRECNQMPAA